MFNHDYRVDGSINVLRLRVSRTNIRGLGQPKRGELGMARMEIATEAAGLGAQTGAADSLFELGMLYATGRDVAADLVVAHKWFNLAAARGNTAALTRRLEVAREMSCEQVAQAQKLAREWLQTN